MRFSPWHQEKKQGDKDYDPTQKNCLVWDVMTHNMLSIVKKAGTNCTIDETTWANAGHADVQGCIIGKMHVSKGGRHTVCVDTPCHFIYAYTQRHKFFSRKKPFIQEGPAKVERLVASTTPLIKTNQEDGKDTQHQVFGEPPCISMENHVSDDAFQQLLGNEGWKSINACCCNCLPANCNQNVFHHIKQPKLMPDPKLQDLSIQ